MLIYLIKTYIFRFMKSPSMMKSLLPVVLMVMMNSCLTYKHSRIYKPVEQQKLLSGLQIIIDTVAVEQAIYPSGYPIVNDAYQLIDCFVKAEISDSTGNRKGYIRIKLSDKYSNFSFLWAAVNMPLLYAPMLLGAPLGAEKVQFEMTVTIYNNNLEPVKAYLSNKTGKAYIAMYWGYSLFSAAERTTSISLSRAANSKAILANLKDIKAQIARDKVWIEGELRK